MSDFRALLLWSCSKANIQFFLSSEVESYLIKQLVVSISTIFAGWAGYANGCRIYLDTMTREKLSPFRLLTWTSFVGQFIHPVGVISASYMFHFIRILDNLV